MSAIAWRIQLLVLSAVPLAIVALLCGCSGSSSTPTGPNTPTSATSGSLLTTCTTIAQAGSYMLSADLGSRTLNPCVKISAPNVTIDCGGHLIDSVAVTGASNVSIDHCAIGAAATLAVPNTGRAFLSITQASQVTVSNSELDDANVTKGQHITFDRDHIVDANPKSLSAIAIESSSFVTVSNSAVDHFVTYGVELDTGHDNTVTNNTIDGSVAGNTSVHQRDDGVVLDTELDDVISHNTISNVPDAGVEGSNSVTNTTIEDNTMQGIGFAGIGSYYETSWHGNTIRGNQVAGNNVFLEFENLPTFGNVNTKLLTDIEFADNIIENNVSHVAGLNGVSVIIHFQTANQTPALPIVVSNNVIRGNDLGATLVFVDPPSGFVDGGGNTCTPSSKFTCK